jgi:hypothetical protein
VVQRGGDRKNICVKVLKRFLEYHINGIDDNMHSVKKAFEVFGIREFYRGNNLLYRLINCRRNIQDPNFSSLISSGGITLTEAEIDKEADFYDNLEYKKNIGEFLTKKNWVNFINYLKVHIRMIEIRQNVCSEIAHLLENCKNSKSYNSKKSVLLNNSFIILEINEKVDKYNILKQIIILRNIGDEQCFFNILFSDDKFTEESESEFIINNAVLIGQYLGRIERGKLPNKSTVENLKKIITPLWIKFLKNLRKTRVIWEEEEKEKLQTEEKKNKELRNLEAEVQRAKANVQARMLESNLGGPEEEEDEPVFISPLLRITHTGRRTTGPANNRPPQNMLNPVGRRRNVKPNQPLHNNQKSQTSAYNRLMALKND